VAYGLESVGSRYHYLIVLSFCHHAWEILLSLGMKMAPSTFSIPIPCDSRNTIK
jgi:hypothetical protein